MNDHGDVIPPEQLTVLTERAASWLAAHWTGGADHPCPHCSGIDWHIAVASLALVQAICQGCGYVAILDGNRILTDHPSV